ncbi:ABC transporter substrate-binding protein [Streptoalloteichus hindustanus]|uniref:Iron complex transport system substrate-binding protein n=1 Tax=Streptoalloteichus hindustanus TaxID=2017 RepID=A0A1M4XKC9_STRHI|nr:ABC transporter substrate-binding protein [Streptoalloteichus hindustanus]SHE94077.1 iron complex transport system substrate-binding protein [Streptoalloteichus hindustanus]
MTTRPDRAGDAAGVSRRRFLAGAAGALALVGLTACGSGGSGGASASPTAVGGGKRTITTALGPVEIPANPQRVVCVDHYTPGALLDVGVTPVGVADFDTNALLADYVPRLQGLPKVGKSNEAKPEKVAELRPDLVLGTHLAHAPDPNAESYKAFAPTALFAAKTAGDWKDRALQAADAVGRRAEGEKVRQRYEERAAGIKKKYADALARTKWSMVQGGRSGEWALVLPGSWGGVVLVDAGVQFGASSAGQQGTTKNFSVEQMDALADSDVILVRGNSDGSIAAQVKPVLEQPVWQGLRAVKNNRVFPLPYFNTLHYGQAEAMLNKIEDILKQL